MLPEAPVFRPTAAEWIAGPFAYIASIRAQAEPFGMARIIPPESARVGRALASTALSAFSFADWRQVPFRNPLEGSSLQFETKRQELQRLQEGRPFGDVSGRCCRNAQARSRAADLSRARHREATTRLLRIESRLPLFMQRRAASYPFCVVANAPGF